MPPTRVQKPTDQSWRTDQGALDPGRNSLESELNQQVAKGRLGGADRSRKELLLG